MLVRNGQRLLRRTVRSAVIDVLSGVNAIQSVAVTRRDSMVLFVYMHFTPDLGPLEELLRFLRTHFELISYSAAVEKLKAAAGPGRYACLSFDDGFATNIAAGTFLAREGVSACFFVCPDAVGLPASELGNYFPGSGLGSELRTLSWDEIETLLAQDHEIGSHTLTHRTLSSISYAEAEHEIKHSKAVLEARLGTVSHFAWPRGTLAHFAPELLKPVIDAGYESCASALRGAHALDERWSFPLIRREHIDLSWPARHQRFFLLRAARTSRSSNSAWPKSWIENSPSSAL